MDVHEFTRNFNAHSVEELAPYVEKHVAWSEDGKQILAAGKTIEELYDEINRLKLKNYIIGFVPDPNISYF